MQYGYQENNPIPQGYHDAVTREIRERVYWTDDRLARIVRFRLLSDPGFPLWDVSYCHGQLKDGAYVEVELPFDQLPRRGWKRALVQWAKKEKVFAQRLGFFRADVLSTLV